MRNKIALIGAVISMAALPLTWECSGVSDGGQYPSSPGRKPTGAAKAKREAKKNAIGNNPPPSIY